MSKMFIMKIDDKIVCVFEFFEREFNKIRIRFEFLQSVHACTLYTQNAILSACIFALTLCHLLIMSYVLRVITRFLFSLCLSSRVGCAIFSH